LEMRKVPRSYEVSAIGRFALLMHMSEFRAYAPIVHLAWSAVHTKKSPLGRVSR